MFPWNLTSLWATCCAHIMQDERIFPGKDEPSTNNAHLVSKLITKLSVNPLRRSKTLRIRIRLESYNEFACISSRMGTEGGDLECAFE